MSNPKYVRQRSNNHLYAYSAALMNRPAEFEGYNGKAEIINGVLQAVDVKSDDQLKAEAVEVVNAELVPVILDSVPASEEEAAASMIAELKEQQNADPEDKFQNMTKKELVAYAEEEYGVKLDAKTTKEGLIAQIKATEEQLG